MLNPGMREQLLRNTKAHIRRTVCPCLAVIAQIGLLAVLNHVGYLVTTTFRLSLPGNLVGMLVLLVLLGTGAIRLRWIENGASLLLKHLAFFFIPIAVGIMTFGELLRSSGVTLFAVLLVSSLFGVWMAGMASQMLAREERPVRERRLTWKKG